MEACCCIDRAQIGARHEWHCIARTRKRSADKSGGCGVCGSLSIKLLPPVAFRLRQKSSKIRFKLADVLAVDFDIEVTKAGPETSSSGRFGGSIRPAHRPLANIRVRGRMISASTMPPSLRSALIKSLAQVSWSGSGCGSTSKRLGFLVGTRAPMVSVSMGTSCSVRVATDE